MCWSRWVQRVEEFLQLLAREDRWHDGKLQDLQAWQYLDRVNVARTPEIRWLLLARILNKRVHGIDESLYKHAREITYLEHKLGLNDTTTWPIISTITLVATSLSPSRPRYVQWVASKYT